MIPRVYLLFQFDNHVHIIENHYKHVIGTPSSSIGRAEDRAAHSSMLQTLGLDQPTWVSATHPDVAVQFARAVGYPVLVRPSFVLSGTAMNVAMHQPALLQFLHDAAEASPNHPVVVSRYIEDARYVNQSTHLFTHFQHFTLNWFIKRGIGKDSYSTHTLSLNIYALIVSPF